MPGSSDRIGVLRNGLWVYSPANDIYRSPQVHGLDKRERSRSWTGQAMGPLGTGVNQTFNLIIKINLCSCLIPKKNKEINKT